jgi:Pentapeptide repeats (8 copies)
MPGPSARASVYGSGLSEADLNQANLNQANLSGANLSRSSLWRTNLTGANLSGANLMYASLVDVDFTGANLTGCRIYGVSAWGLKLEGAKQENLVIAHSHGYAPTITVDNIEVAQFVYIMLNNQKIRNVIDTITSKAVLILGRFTADRKKVLDAIREELRKRNYLPILFDFGAPKRQNVTETVTLLARMARFIIADLTDSSSIPQELQAIITSVRVPIQPLLVEGSPLYSMFNDFDPQDFHWVLPVYQYREPKQLLATLADVIAPAEGKAEALEKRRAAVT